MATVVKSELTLPHFSRDNESQALVHQFFDRIHSVSSLPTTAMRILEVTGDPRSEVEDLLRVVQADPPIAARIMRIVNSSFYPLRETVGELKTAITLLGFSEIRNLALTACMSSWYGYSADYRGYSRQGLWNHCIGVGTVSRVIARNSGRAVAGEAYLAGLLHDLGLILINQYLQRPFCQVLDQLTPEVPTQVAEMRVLGFDHTELGSHIARRWRFPDEVTAAIRHHHAPQLYEGPHRDTVWIVAMANFLCGLHDLTSLGVRNLCEPADEIIDALDFRPDDIPRLKEQLEETLSQASLMAGV